MAAALNNPSASKRWTFADLMQFDETERYEIYDGKLIPAGRPTPPIEHQRISGQLFRLLDNFTEARQLGEAFFGPLDVVFAEDNTAEPDLLFIAKENAGIAQKWVMGAPDLLIEILFPSTIRRDRYEKREQYARFRVKEYWIIDPAWHSVEILTLQDHRLMLHSMAAETGNTESKVLAGLSIDVAALF